jgi:hypothetical protein
MEDALDVAVSYFTTQGILMDGFAPVEEVILTFWGDSEKEFHRQICEFHDSLFLTTLN